MDGKVFTCMKNLGQNECLLGTGNENLKKIDVLDKPRGLLVNYDLRDE